jgi:hypothetical protein
LPQIVWVYRRLGTGALPTRSRVWRPNSEAYVGIGIIGIIVIIVIVILVLRLR